MNPSELEQQIRAAYDSNPMTDVEILGAMLQRQDADADYLQARDTYAWYHAIGSVLKPRVIAEVGVRFGYSLRSLAAGAGPDALLIGYDSQQYVADSNVTAHLSLKRFPNPFVLFGVNTTHTKGSINARGVDLFNVDGDHNEGGALSDLHDATRCLSPGGVMLIDDITFIPEVKRAADRFCMERGIEFFDLPTFRGLRVIASK